MYFEFDQALQAGLDCAGDLGPEQGAVFGWVRHPAGEVAELRVETSPGVPVETLLLITHPRGDVDVPEGMAVSGFSLIHDVPRHASERLLIIRTGGREVAVDLFAYDLPSDVEATTLNRQWGATFQLLHASARDPGRIRTLDTDGETPGIFRGWLDRLPRLAGSAEWFMEFRRASAALMPDGEMTVSGGFTPAAGVPPQRIEAAACVLITPAAGPAYVLPLAGERSAGLEGGFVLYGQVPVPPGATAEAIVELRRGKDVWWFRAEAAASGLPAFLDALSLAGVELAGGDPGVLQGWIREALADRGEGLRARLSGLGLAGGAAAGGTALVFDLNDEYAARVLALLAPQIEARFGRIVLSGAAAGRAAAGLARRGRAEILLEADAGRALATAALGDGPVTPIDTPALVDAAIGGNLTHILAGALPADRLRAIEVLHDVAGLGDMAGTLRRVVALMGGADAAGLPMPTQRPDVIGGIVAEHLRELWEMVPVTGIPR